MIEKNRFGFKTKIDFNYISDLLEKNNYTSIFSGNMHISYVLNGCFLIRDIENSPTGMGDKPVEPIQIISIKRC